MPQQLVYVPVRVFGRAFSYANWRPSNLNGGSHSMSPLCLSTPGGVRWYEFEAGSKRCLYIRTRRSISLVSQSDHDSPRSISQNVPQSPLGNCLGVSVHWPGSPPCLLPYDVFVLAVDTGLFLCSQQWSVSQNARSRGET